MVISEQNQNAPSVADDRFPTTQWGVVLAAGHSSCPGVEQALEKLCRAYWPPVYAFVRRQGPGPDDALDLTQEFFARFLQEKHLKSADPERGKFRSFLLSCTKHFLANEWKRGHAEKRGGGGQFISLDEHRQAETRFLAEPADPAAAPDQAFEKIWALTLLEHTLARLGDEFRLTARAKHFDSLKALVWGDQTAVSQVQVAAKLGMTPNALGVVVHRLRRRFGELLREEIADTVAGEAEIDAELRHLIKVIGSN